MNDGGLSMVPAYASNPLIQACGPLRSRKEIANAMKTIPPVPRVLTDIPDHIRKHMLEDARRLYLPTMRSLDFAEAIDIAIRQSYVGRNPLQVETWRWLNNGACSPLIRPTESVRAAFQSGHSGTGKTADLTHVLDSYQQVHVHESFPTMASPLKQLLWLRINAPPSGSALDLAECLMIATDRALGTDYFERFLTPARGRVGSVMLNAWWRRVAPHFLALLAIEEIMNLFKLAPVRYRRKMGGSDVVPLSIKDDETLKFVLKLTNEYGLVLVANGTADGMAALKTRFAVTQRMVSAGFYATAPFSSPQDEVYEKLYLPKLMLYYYLDEPAEDPSWIGPMLWECSGGVQRIIVTLWIFSQRRALNRRSRNTPVIRLTVDDVKRAMSIDMAPLMPAVEALKQGVTQIGNRYEDLLPKDSLVWTG